jgi:hypothetical protein
MHDATLLLQSDAAQREIGRAAREAVHTAMKEHGADVRRLYELLADQRGILTVHRLADLLGVTERTVTERYVKRGLPCVRLAVNGPPLFLLEDVVAWLRQSDIQMDASRREAVQ